MSPRGPSHLRSSVIANGEGEEGPTPTSASGAPKTPAELVKVPEFVPSRHSHSHSQSFSFSQPPQEFYPPPGLPPLPSHRPVMNGDEHQQHSMETPGPMYNPYAPQPQQQYYYAPPGQAEGYGYDAQPQGYEGYEYGPQSAMGAGYEPQVQGYDPMVGMPGMGSPYEMYGGQPHGGTVYYA